MVNKLESVTIFVRVVERGSFNAVVEDMPLSGTVIGLHIKALAPEQLSEHRCLGFAHPLAGSEWLLERDGKLLKVAVNVVMAVNNGEALRKAALNGLGILMQPEVLLAEDLRQGRLIALLPDWQPAPKPVHILTFADRQQLPKIRYYVDFLLQHFGSADAV